MIHLDEERYVTGLKVFTSMTVCKNQDFKYNLSKFCNIVASVISSLVISTAYFNMEEECAQYPSQVPLGELTTILCDNPRTASSVRIQRYGERSLQLCEVEILAKLSTPLFVILSQTLLGL